MFANEFKTLDAQLAESRIAQVEPQEIGGEDDRPLCEVNYDRDGLNDFNFNVYHVYHVYDPVRDEIVFSAPATNKQAAYESACYWANDNGYRIVTKA